jgi:methanogenic corrinoid protein MtbC1
MINKRVSETQMSSYKKNTLSQHKEEKKVIPISLINRALEELTNQDSVGAQKRRKKNLEKLCVSLFSLDGEAKSVIHSMLDSGISAKEIFEVFIPDAARQLGRCWIQNTLSFAEVTLATSKLQTIAKQFEGLYIGSFNSGASGPEIMIISPKQEQHTFGAQMITRQFQRLGVSPYLSINNNVDEIRKIINKHKFKLIGLSLANYKSCSPKSDVRSIVGLAKQLKIPILAGGSLIYSHKNAVESLNVDMITDDAIHALRCFDIKLSRSKAASDFVIRV